MSNFNDIKDQRIADALFLLSRDNYWDSIKIVYDLLINEVYLYATKEKRLKQHEIEENGKDVLCYLHEMLIIKNVKNISAILSEIRLLTIFFNNFSRESINTNINNYKVRVLVLNLIGLIKFLSQRDKNYAYNFGSIESPLIHELQNNLTEEIYKSTTPYFEIRQTSIDLFAKDFWVDLNDSFINHQLSIFNDEELEFLQKYSYLIDCYQLSLKKNERDIIEELWNTYLSKEDIIKKVILQYQIIGLVKELDEFRKSDLSSGKYNIYKTELEKGFHKNIYPYLTKCNFDTVISEFNSGDQRHDIILYKNDQTLSTIIELKVNNLTNLEDDVIQLEEYLDKVQDKKHLFMQLPTFGILAVYYIGEKKKLNLININDHLSRDKIKKHSDNFYLINRGELCPIIIALFNGRN